MRKVSKFYWILCFLLLAFCGCIEQKETAENKQPNIVFLFADDQRYNTISALGNNEIITPHLDQLVQTGTSFTNAYIMGAMNGAVCAPSRAMLMTSRNVFQIQPAPAANLNMTDTLLPRALSNGGYKTFHTGKWHNGKKAFTAAFNAGSKIFFGGMNDQYAVPTHEFNIAGNYADSLITISTSHSSELYANAAINFIENVKEDTAPFFMYVAFQAPHDPREMPQKYLDMYPSDQVKIPENFMPRHPFDNGELDIRDEWLAGFPRTKEEVKANIIAYYAMITHLDVQIGRILHALNKSGLRDDTVIVFSSDNGLAVGQHGLMGKQNLYEHSIKVPLIFQGPNIPKNVQKETFTNLIDIYPTLCNIATSEVPSLVEGKNLLPVIHGKEKEVHQSLIYAYKNNQRAIRKGDYKLIKYRVDEQTQNQLFNLQSDPWELQNLYNKEEYKNLISELETALQKQLNKAGDGVQFTEPNWGVPTLPRWIESVSQKTQDWLRGLAEKERKMRGF